jgi:hypothetical protein
MLNRPQFDSVDIMKVTITAHGAAQDGDEDSHCFYFLVEEEESEPRAACVALRTAQVMARELASYTGLDAMMRAIAAMAAKDYDSLIGAQYCDQ